VGKHKGPFDWDCVLDDDPEPFFFANRPCLPLPRQQEDNPALFVSNNGNGQTQFDRWLVLMAGGPNAQLAIELLPALTALSHKPLVSLCQVFEPTDGAADLTTLDRAADFLHPYLNDDAIKTVPLDASSIPEAVLNYAHQDCSDVIIMGASRAGILQQVVNGNIPASISQNSDRTVILVRGRQ
jgi:chloride channel protein, CIC family